MTDLEAIIEIWEIMFNNEEHNALYDAKDPKLIVALGEKCDNISNVLIKWSETSPKSPKSKRVLPNYLKAVKKEN